MAKIIYFHLMLTVLFIGCASINSIEQAYNYQVDVSDGVNAHEAKIMAQKEILKVYEQHSYRLTAPGILDSVEALKYPDMWFVVFGHDWLSPISKDPMAKTYTQLKQAIYLVVINKSTGYVQFSGEWYPKVDKGFETIMGDKPAPTYRNRFQAQAFIEGHPIGK